MMDILRREKQTDGAKREENNDGKEKKQTNSNDRGGKWGSKRKEMKRKNSIQSQSFWSIYQFSPILNVIFLKSYCHNLLSTYDILTGLDHVWCSLRCALQTTTEK